MLSINKRKEGITRSTSFAFVVLIINLFVMNTEVIFTFDNLFFVGYMNAFV